jgi:hypothetical protein
METGGLWLSTRKSSGASVQRCLLKSFRALQRRGRPLPTLKVAPSARCLVRASRDLFLARRFAPRALMVNGKRFSACRGGTSEPAEPAHLRRKSKCQRKERAVIAFANCRKRALPAARRALSRKFLKKKKVLTHERA